MNDHHAILDSRASWLRLAVTLVIASVANVGMWAVIMVLPDVQAEFGVDRADASIPYTATMVGFALGNLLIGRAVDRFGIVRSMMVAALTIAAGFSLSALAGSIWTVSALHFVMGFGTAAAFGPLIADVSHWFLRRRGIAVSIAASGNYIAGAIWPNVLAGVLETDGWRAVYLWLAVIVLGVTLPGLLFLRAQVPDAAKSVADAYSTARRQAISLGPRTFVALLALAGVACCVAMSMPQVHIVAFCVDLGYGPAVGAQMLALMLLGGVVSRIFSGFIADWLGGVKTLLIGSTLQCIALFMFLPFDGMVPLYIVSALFGLSQGGIVPSYAIIVREYLPARTAGARVGLVIMATIVGMALGGWMSGWIYDETGGYRWAFLNGIAWNFLNIGIVAMIAWQSRRVRPVAAT